MTPIYTEDEKKQRVQASIRYNKKNVRQIMLSLNIKTDADIIEKLDCTGNKQGYIKQLIRSDIHGHWIMDPMNTTKGNDYASFSCSNCDHVFPNSPKFCPDCGCNMDEPLVKIPNYRWNKAMQEAREKAEREEKHEY